MAQVKVKNVTVGMMDPAYFVGRKKIIDWLNGLLKLNLSKIEDTSNGAVACQVMDALFPRQVPMQRVDWGARADYQSVENYKILQGVFTKLSINKQVGIKTTLNSHNGYQDNLEFLQWMKKFFEINRNDETDVYNAVKRRAKGKNVRLYKAAAKDFEQPLSKESARKERGTRSKAQTKENENDANQNKKPDRKINHKTEDTLRSLQKENAFLKRQNEELKKTGKITEELSKELQVVEKERDYYFDKLRKTEVILQGYTAELKQNTNGNKDGKGDEKYDLVRKILTLMYASEKDVDGTAAFSAFESQLK